MCFDPLVRFSDDDGLRIKNFSTVGSGRKRLLCGKAEITFGCTHVFVTAPQNADLRVLLVFGCFPNPVNFLA